MKAVILAGGLGTRLSEETSIKPKPMVEVGGRPILWTSFDENLLPNPSASNRILLFVCGYKGYIIKE
ncbi:MAG: glucose-1-phosphate cytidylyltransferase, partial [Leptolyngbyaceae cyanobacterium SL_7_1]|nr:glucose-1-phosphate cytidylyltransferase [Leptolyngbyaceae cyanobacterium SL_7_1]